ncbi:non-ribosomal peptide synthetase [Actinomadura gamaensis]|uniref:Condensation domain-containing protein n=1 Tax=Actinomadura gamaensis TaxID=1763541 RepID=A0ABV9TZ64_9ACTN
MSVDSGTARPERLPLVPQRGNHAGAPLSYAQERAWLFELAHPGTALQNISLALRLTGDIDPATLRHSIRKILRRHEVLRTGFFTENGGPVQRVAANVTESLVAERLSNNGLTAGQRDAAMRQWTRKVTCEPFDIEEPPLLRVGLLQVDEGEHVLVLVTHRLVADSQSMRVLMAELIAGDEAEPPDRLPFHYADFAAWQRSRTFPTELAHWRSRLADAPVGLPVPRNLPLPVVLDDVPRHPKQNREHLHVRTRLVTALKELAAQQGTSLSVVLHTAFAVLLARYSGQDDIVIATTAADRRREELERLIGAFSDVKPLRTNLAGEPTFRQALDRVQKAIHIAHAHQDVPFDRLVQELWPQQHSVGSPAVQVGFELVDLKLVDLKLVDRACAGTARSTVLACPPPDARFTLALQATLTDSGLNLEVGYHEDVFRPDFIATMLDGFHALLRNVVDDPDSPVHDVPLTEPAHLRALPDPTLPPRRHVLPPIAELLEASAAHHRDLPVLVQGEHRWSYGRLSEHAHELADVLRANGHVPGEVVAVATRSKSFDLYAAIWAVWLARGILLLVDTTLPQARRTEMITRADARTALALDQESAAAMTDSPAATVLNCSGTEVTVIRRGGRPSRHLGSRPGADDPAYVFFTSGSTGSPKALLGRHNGLSHFVTWQSRNFGIGGHDRCAPLLSLSADAVLRDVFTPLVSGACLHLPVDPAMRGGDASLPLPWLHDEAITMLHTVPSLASAAMVVWPNARPLEHLRLLFIAGEPLSGRLVERLRALAPNADVVNLYGTSECTMVQTHHRVPPSFDARDGANVPAGTGVPDVDVLVVTRGGTLCAPGEVGEVLIRSPHATLGYLDHEGPAGFVPNPFRDDPADRVFRTGDLGRYQPDGTVEILGRSSERTSGTRPDEVNALLEAHPAVAASTVLVTETPVACVVLKEGRTASPDELRRFLRRSCPPEAVPTAFVYVDQIPVTTIGKLDRRRRLASLAGGRD